MTSTAAPHTSHRTTARIASIDALRGLVMLLMLVDHTREYFYLHAQVGDPMGANVSPGLFATRLCAHICAPVFIALTGLSAWLYGQKHGVAGARAFLFKRGLFLVALEITLVNFAWTFDLTPETYFLQVIWVIGLSMIALAGLIGLSRPALFLVAGLIVLGHNLLDGIHLAAGEPGHILWTVLHDRGRIALDFLPWSATARTSYPLLPWIGAIALGWCAGPWFAKQTDIAARQRRLWLAAGVMFAVFVVLRTINGYGEPVPRWHTDSALMNTLSFFNLTKYPPSADFILCYLSIGTALLAALYHMRPRGLTVLAWFGSAPLFFYLLHLYLLHGANRLAGLFFEPAHGALVSVDHWAWLWLIAAGVALATAPACRRFGALKQRSDWAWLKYL